MNYKFKIVVDEICEVGTTARKVTYDTVVTLKEQDGLDRQIYIIETESSENNLIERSFDDFFYNH